MILVEVRKKDFDGLRIGAKQNSENSLKRGQFSRVKPQSLIVKESNLSMSSGMSHRSSAQNSPASSK